MKRGGEGGGGEKKNLPWGGVWIFSETAQSIISPVIFVGGKSVL